MKYYTKEWQKRISDAPDNARALADEARTGYRAEQNKNSVPEDAVAYICPICWWENDVFTADDDEPSDENHGISLNEGRKNFRQYGICDPRLNEPMGRSSGEAVIPPHPVSDPIIGGSHTRKSFVKTQTGKSK